MLFLVGYLESCKFPMSLRGAHPEWSEAQSKDATWQSPHSKEETASRRSQRQIVKMGTEGIEPSRLSAHDPKSCSSASSDTSPVGQRTVDNVQRKRAAKLYRKAGGNGAILVEVKQDIAPAHIHCPGAMESLILKPNSGMIMEPCLQLESFLKTSYPMGWIG